MVIVRNRYTRRGISLMVVMVAISMSLVLTYCFVRTQATVIRISQNTGRRDLALQAAWAGAAFAVQRIQSPDWSGVGEQPYRVVHTDGEGTASFAVEFRPPQVEDLLRSPAFPKSRASMPEDSAMYVVVRSTGTWQSAQDPNERVERYVEVVVQLRPRLPGRTINPGDSATADDLAENPGDYNDIQQYALFAKNGTTSLVLDPADRIDGKVWLYEYLKLYEAPRWSSSVRNVFLESIGSSLVTNDGQVTLRHPHPIAGDVTFYLDPPGWLRNDVDRLGVPWSQTATQPTYPTIDFADWWPTYRLYEGGFEYQAIAVDWRLQNVTLRPTPDNPLGIFYRYGDVRVDDNVTIQGTLVATGAVIFQGDFSHVASFNWLGENGQPIAANTDDWPRLPAIVADKVHIDRNIKARIEGAVVVKRSLKGAGGNFEYVSTNDVTIVGTATSQPIRQPWSIVQLQGTPDLSQLNDRGDYAIWLDDGATGGWYAIVGVDRIHHKLTVVGEVRHGQATHYQIGRNRRRYIDIHGPVSGEKHDIKRPPAWAEPSESQWNDLHDAWKALNLERNNNNLQPVEFVDWLANPVNFSSWQSPYHNQYGLNLNHVTFHLRNTSGIRYRWSPPLFAAYDGTGTEEEFAGYRWKVISWRVVP